jgi:hypothetical protein
MLLSMRQAVLLLFFLNSSFFAAQGQGNEAVSINKVLANPSSYHLQTITLQGTIQQLQLLTPYWQINRECYAATFSLVDATGTIAVLVPGPCGNPTLNPTPVLPYADGDYVIVETRVQAPGYYTGQGLPPGGEVRQTPRAIAIRVQPIPDHR